MQKMLGATLLTLHLLMAHADEGMWTFDKIPVDTINQKYGVKLSQDWINHARLSSLRVSLGGSASFVSSQGLVMTNHHVASKAIYNLSNAKMNIMEQGFYAETLEKELPCPNMYVDQLIEIRDVTNEVMASFTPDMSFADKEAARKKALALLKESAEKESNLKVEAVTLFQGARYNLYLYKRYTDVRLVMAPEKLIAYFGGDIENFEYPRYDLDVTFFRVYDEGKPLATQDYLTWSPTGPIEGEPLFVMGNPGSTKRIFTADHLQFLKETSLPQILQFIDDRIKTLEQYASQSPEAARQASDYLFSLRNSQKALSEEEEGLTNSPIIADKAKAEALLFQTVPQKDQQAWSDLKKSLTTLKSYMDHYIYLERLGFRFSKEYVYARDLVRYATEMKKPNETRLPEYQDGEIETMKMKLLSTEPLYPLLEKVMLGDSLKGLSTLLGSSNALVITVLGSNTPQQKADQIINQSQMGNVDYRKQLLDNPSLIDQSQDPMILLVKQIDPLAMQLRKRYEEEFDSTQKASYAQIMNIYFQKYGDSLYPDATFTPRLSYGVMKGYFNKGLFVEPMTDYKGLFRVNSEHDNKAPYDLPANWLKLSSSLDGSTPLNFVSTNDIIGGNSGSPVVNQKGQVVGLIFDGNQDSQLWDLEYSDATARAVSVHSTGIFYALQKVYKADRLLSEIKTPGN